MCIGIKDQFNKVQTVCKGLAQSGVQLIELKPVVTHLRGSFHSCQADSAEDVADSSSVPVGAG